MLHVLTPNGNQKIVGYLTETTDKQLALWSPEQIVSHGFENIPESKTTFDELFQILTLMIKQMLEELPHDEENEVLPGLIYTTAIRICNHPKIHELLS